MKKAAKKKPKLTLRRALNQIERMLQDGNVGEDLWIVLTALRGPDTDDGLDRVKGQTTVRVRSAAFPKLAEARYCHGALIGDTWQNAIELTRDDVVKIAGSHFVSHTHRAADRLGVVVFKP